MDCRPPGSSIHGIFQARILRWVAIASSKGSFLPKHRTRVSPISCTAGGFLTAEPWGRSRYSDEDTFLKWKGAFNLSAGTAGVNWNYARQTGTGNVRGKEDHLGFFRGSVLNCATPLCLLPARSFLQLPMLAILHFSQG